MLKQLRLENFRRFEAYTVPLKDHSIIVGPNNAGKSTIVEGLRLLSLAANRYQNLQYLPVPAWLTEPVGVRGVTPSLRDLNTNLTRVFHNYSEPPALVEGTFTTGTTVSVYVGPEEAVYAVVRAPDGKVVTSKAAAQRVEASRVAIQPQVAPMTVTERALDVETVRRGLDSSLAPSHFRNQLVYLRDEYFDRFVVLAETTWPGLQIQDLVEHDDGRISLFLRDGAFVGEVALMGHGLQMWLQVVWFLARNEAAPTLVLDEPDVYLHADLQRKLIRLVQGSNQQVVIATHSTEIMAEVAPENILTINSQARRARWANTLSGVQKIIDSVGGLHNVQLARLANARRCLFVEGDDDAQVIKTLADTLHSTLESLDTVPRLAVGGWDGWQRVVGTSQFLRNASGDAIQRYAIFDSDYHPPAAVVERYTEAEALGIYLHVWTRKEVENYLLVPSCIHRLAERSVRSGRSAPDVEEIEAELKRICGEHVEDARDDCAAQYAAFLAHKPQISTANKVARKYVDLRLAEPDGLLGLAPGKKVLQRLSAWMESRSGRGFGSVAIARELRVEELVGRDRSGGPRGQ